MKAIRIADPITCEADAREMARELAGIEYLAFRGFSFRASDDPSGWHVVMRQGDTETIIRDWEQGYDVTVCHYPSVSAQTARREENDRRRAQGAAVAGGRVGQGKRHAVPDSERIAIAWAYAHRDEPRWRTTRFRIAEVFGVAPKTVGEWTTRYRATLPAQMPPECRARYDQLYRDDETKGAA